MPISFPSGPEVIDGYEYVYTDPEGAELIFYWKADDQLWYSTTNKACGGGSSDEIGEITLTIVNEQATWSAYSGTYEYLSTNLYVSKSEDFSDLTDGFTWTSTDSSVTSVFISGLDYNTTYYARVAYTDKVGNRAFSETVSFTSSDIPDFEDFIVTQNFGALDLSSYPQGARVNIAFIDNGGRGQDGGKGWNGSETWNGGGGPGAGSGAFKFYDGTVAEFSGQSIDSLKNDGPGVTNLGGSGGGRSGNVYQTGDDANGGPGGTLPTTNWGVLSEFNGYTFETGSGGSRGIATSPPSGGGQGGGGGGGGLRLSGPNVPGIPNAQNASNGNHGQGNGGGGQGFGAGGGGGGGCRENENPGTGGNGAAGIALVKVFYRRSQLLTDTQRYVIDDPEYV
jgi:hypothetical protein